MSQTNAVQPAQQSEAIEEPGQETRERSVMPFAERVKLVDYLRALRSPIAAETKAEASKLVAEALGLELTWNHIRYVIEQMPADKLADKFVIGDEADRGLALKIIELEERVKNVETALAAALQH